MTERTRIDRPHSRFVDHLPDLITEEDYRDPPDRKKVRIRITITTNGVEILGDSMYAPLLERLLGEAGADEIERMLCG
jgi:hypothetical protein